MALITFEDVSFGYEGKIACENISFEVNAGDYLCIVGENGSGKSTLIKGLLGLKNPCAGKLYTGDGLKQTEIGYLPQQTPVQKDFPASVYEVVLSGCLNNMGLKPFYTKLEKQLVRKNMEKLGIESLKNHCYRELSGGQQQRVLLARALCATKKLLLLDEPVTGLDPIAANSLYKLISQLNKEGVTIIMVSHDIHHAVSQAGLILHMNKSPLFFGKTEDYIRSDIGKVFAGGDVK
ncbi:metal ABC transporter ATP-binding protein [Tissierella sp. Yu-01]|uniref:metal ABC transporter ATP-binding protein n=1 Tax=Tissierella sp. Yu-01 TaxID=3035694 RepID=UPI00240CF54F|nr:metal ABC transporter ATP-binding protein [Tissierella sp. Yu-01]WFA08934.1 metal ABC transporter ATP-binding protein [Tissierella sp. Yu-01]